MPGLDLREVVDAAIAEMGAPAQRVREVGLEFWEHWGHHQIAMAIDDGADRRIVRFLVPHSLLERLTPAAAQQCIVATICKTAQEGFLDRTDEYGFPDYIEVKEANEE